MKSTEVSNVIDPWIVERIALANKYDEENPKSLDSIILMKKIYEQAERNIKAIPSQF